MPPSWRVLVVSQDSAVQSNVVSWLSVIEGVRCTRARWEQAGTAAPSSDVMIAHSGAEGPSDATGRLESLRAQPIAKPKLVILPTDSDDRLLGLAGRLAEDFVVAPVRGAELCARVVRLLRYCPEPSGAAHSRLSSRLGLEQLVGEEPVFLEAIAPLARIAQSGLPLVITGETGTGKELCARAAHHLGPRRDHPFVAVDCSALPENLFENELFGHVRGAYTDAHTDHRGLIAMAEGGTLFLDEVDALSLAAQAKLLRFLQERAYRPLGSSALVPADVHVVTASNRSLESCVEAKTFRSDLYYRLSVVHIRLPALRDRPEDIDRLAEHFVRTSRLASSPPKVLTPSARAKLRMFDWPGNVRQLLNVVQRAIWFSEGTAIRACDVALPGHSSGDVSAAVHSFRQARSEMLERFERSYVVELMRKHGGNVTRAAAEAGKERRAFGRMVKKYRLN